MGKFGYRRIGKTIYAVYSHNHDWLKLSTKVKVEEIFWDKKVHQLKSSHPEYSEIDRDISKVLKRIKDALAEARRQDKEPTVPFLRRCIESPQTTIHWMQIPFREKFQSYLLFKNNAVTPSYLEKLVVINQSLIAFEDAEGQHYTPELFDVMAFSRLILYMQLTQKKADSTIKAEIQKFRAFLRWAYPEMKIQYVKHNKTPPQNIITLTEEELQTLKKATLTGHLEKARDIFLFMVGTGIRHSDLRNLTTDNIQEGGIMQFYQKKTGQLATPVLSQTVTGIFHKYGGKAPYMSAQKLNDYLKIVFAKLAMDRRIVFVTSYNGRIIQETIPLHEKITSHVARKTFITHALAAGIPVQVVMKMSGHADYNSLAPYMEIANNTLQKEAQKWQF